MTEWSGSYNVVIEWRRSKQGRHTTITGKHASSQVSRIGMRSAKNRRLLITHWRPATVVEQVAWKYFSVHLSSGKGLSRNKVPLRTGKATLIKLGECTKSQFIGSCRKKSERKREGKSPKNRKYHIHFYVKYMISMLFTCIGQCYSLKLYQGFFTVCGQAIGWDNIALG